MANISNPQRVILSTIRTHMPVSCIKLMEGESQEEVSYHPNQSFTFFPNVRRDVRDWLEHDCKWKFAIMSEEDYPGFMKFKFQIRYLTTQTGNVLQNTPAPLDLNSKDIKRTIVFQDIKGTVEFKLRFVE